jgi:hypothetical protein
MTGTIWTKFFWSDWESDEALRLCSLASQGLWMRMLCLAAKADPTGYVTVNGRPLGVTDIARLAGVTETECESLLSELDRNGVFSRTRSGTIYSRRMMRDAKRRQIAQKNGKSGGNPSLSKDKDKSPPDNPPLKGRLKTQEPEAKSQEPEREPATPEHRRLARDALAQGKAVLTDWEKQFLGSLLSCRTLSPAQRDTFSAIREKLAEAVAAGITSADDEWPKRMAWARQNRQWSFRAWGPAPHEPGCKVPAGLLQPDDGKGWTEWKAA